MSGRFHPVPDLAAYLSGRWRIARTLRDDRAGLTGGLTGELSIRPDADGALDWREEGRLDFGGYKGPAYRNYRIDTGDAPARVLFEDGRFFHDLDLSSGAWRTLHPCAEDMYHGLFLALSPGAWLTRWRVLGPRKRQIIDSRMERLG